MDNKLIVGIDLGTTNSLISVWDEDGPRIIPNALGQSLTPSCVGFSDSGRIVVGTAARERLRTHPHLTAANFKRYMGSPRVTKLGQQEFRPEELSSFVLRSLKADAEAFLGCAVEEAIISVPAYFSDAQRKATQVAGRLAGFKVERLINEPTAAALAYGMKEKQGENQFLIFDLGGGTFDVSILEMFDGVMEVRASAGDNFLGGEDFISAVCDHFATTVAVPAGIVTVELPPSQLHKLRHVVEQLIKNLSEQPEAGFAITLAGKELQYRLGEDEFARLCGGMLARIRLPIERALRDARIRASSLSNILLAGGASRMPIVRKLVARMFGRFPACHINPDEVVALGAAVQVGLKMKHAALDEIVMTDVCPYTLGIRISQQVGPGQRDYIDGYYLPVLERNTVVPVSRSRDIVTVADNQARLVIDVYQGEGRLVKDNIPLGNFTVDVPRRPAGQAGANVRFTYDVNGILEVEATISETGQQHRLVVQENPGVLSEEEVEAQLLTLSRLKLHPREDARNIAALAKADRLYEEMLGPVRNEIAARVAQFQLTIERQDSHEIADFRERFEAFLKLIEQQSLDLIN